MYDRHQCIPICSKFKMASYLRWPRRDKQIHFSLLHFSVLDFKVFDFGLILVKNNDILSALMHICQSKKLNLPIPDYITKFGKTISFDTKFLFEFDNKNQIL